MMQWLAFRRTDGYFIIANVNNVFFTGDKDMVYVNIPGEPDSIYRITPQEFSRVMGEGILEELLVEGNDDWS